MLLHRLQQGRLGPRGRAVDLVDEEEIREDGPGDEAQGAGVGGSTGVQGGDEGSEPSVGGVGVASRQVEEPEDRPSELLRLRRSRQLRRGQALLTEPERAVDVALQGRGEGLRVEATANAR